MGIYGYGGYRPYGSLTLSASPISYVEPLSLTEVREHLNLPQRSPTDGDEDAMLQDFITAAREISEVKYGRDLVRKQWDLSLNYLCGGDWIELRDPLASVDLFRYRDSSGAYTTLTEGTDYLVDTSQHAVTPLSNSFWPSFTPWASSAVLIRYTSGYAQSDMFWSDAGKRIRARMLYRISGWYNNRLPYAESRSIQDYPGLDELDGLGGKRNVR